MEPIEITEKIVRALDSKKAGDIKVIKVEDITTIADYFVIASASSTTQIKALAGEVEYQLEQADIRPGHKEGFESSSWILMDYGSVVVHLFLKDFREFYSLERLWSDGCETDISNWIIKE